MREGQVGLLGHIRVNIPVTVAVLIVLMATALIVSHILFPSVREHLKFGATVMAGAAAIYGAYYAGKSLRESLLRGKKKNSFEMLQVLNCIDMAKIRHLIENEISDKNISPNELYEKILAESDLLAAITTLLGLFEDMSIAIQQDYADEYILFLSLEHLVPWSYDGLIHYINECRRKHNNPRVYRELQKLANEWKENRSIVTRKPLLIRSNA